MRKSIATAAAGLALFTGTLAIAGTAYAQSERAPAPPAGQGEHLGRRGPAHRLVSAVIKTAADTIGVEPRELLNQLRQGKSIAEVATEHGVDPQAVVDAVVAKANERIDQAVADGKLSSERAAQIKEKLSERVTQLVQHTFGGRGIRGNR